MDSLVLLSSIVFHVYSYALAVKGTLNGKKNRISYMHEKNVFSLYLNPPQQASKGHCGET